MTTTICIVSKFLSTLSLRRATQIENTLSKIVNHFYPRSPCGERRWLRCWQLAARDISIHALLAESDFISTLLLVLISLFLSTLSLRRATSKPKDLKSRRMVFLSTLSLRRATHYDNYNLHCVEISIHALLAESDSPCCGWL